MAIERQQSHIYSASAFRRPQVAVDLILFVIHDSQLGVVLVPSQGCGPTPRWELPTAIVEDQISLEVVLEGLAETLLGSKVAKKKQVATFDRLADPRGRLIEIGYLAVATFDALDGASATHTIGYQQAGSGDIPTRLQLVDQAGERLEISTGDDEPIIVAIERLRQLLSDDRIALEVLASEFTLRELHTVHQAMLGETLNYDSFRRRMLASSILEPTGRLERDVNHRPAELYRVRSGH